MRRTSPGQPHGRPRYKKGVAVAGARGQHLGRQLAKNGRNGGGANGRDNDAPATGYSYADDRAHSGGEDNGEVLEENDDSEEMLLIGKQSFDSRRRPASFFRQVANPNAIGGYYGDFDAVKQGVAQEASQKDGYF